MKNFWEKLTGIQYLYLGFAALFVSILCTILGAYLFFYTDRSQTGFRIIAISLCMGISFFCFCIRKRQSFSTDKEADLDIKDKPYILYLRSFNDDSETDKPLNTSGQFYTEEEILVTSLEKLGTAVAIGRPGEQAPPLGARRIYVSDEQWQDKVRELSADARLVVFRFGETEGLKWEWSHCLDTIEDVSKLLLVVPASMASKQDIMDQLVERIEKQRDDIQCDAIDVSQPLNIGSIGLVLYFEKKENGTFIAKQARGLSAGGALKRQFAYFWKALRNIRPETRDFYWGFCVFDSMGENAFTKMKCSLEPVFNRFSISPFNEKFASWMFRIIQALVYIFVICLALMTILIICGSLGLLQELCN